MSTENIPKPTESAEEELERFRRDEPKKIAERDYWRTRARKAEAILANGQDEGPIEAKENL